MTDDHNQRPVIRPPRVFINKQAALKASDVIGAGFEARRVVVEHHR